MKWIAAAAAVFVGVFAMMILMMGAALGQGQPNVPGTPTSVEGIPPEYLALYVQAAQEEGIDWSILAAIGSVETDHGRIQGGQCAVSSAGARGPMQFMPGTWSLYGKGGDICNPADAIPAAARYLIASGARKSYHLAILAYNHAEWYVTKVLAKAREYRAAASIPTLPATSLEAEADRMTALQRPYVWGGGHAGFSRNGPWDCSGAISWLMHSLGMLNGTPITSTGFERWGAAGRGQQFTIYANPIHVFLIMESGPRKGLAWGTTNNPLDIGPIGPGGPAWHHHGTAGFTARHWPGG